MNKRLLKEVRPLILPTGLTALVAAVPLAKSLIERLLPGSVVSDLLSSLSPIGLFGFWLGIALLAAMSFGSEFQQRTLVLLLSQPIARLRVWREKMLVLVLLVAAVGSIQYLAARTAGFSGPGESWITTITVLVAGIVTIVCSTGFWTLVARSTIGGMVFTLAAIFLLVVGVNSLVEKMYAPDVLPFDAFPNVVVVIIAGLFYSALFLWLGWRKFANLELRDVSPGEGVLLPEAFVSKRLSRLICCRPNGSLRNLIRKELRLQKPIFMIVAAFSLCWLVTLTLLFVQPSREAVFETIFNVLTAFYVPLTVLLIGCVSLGEEKSIGLTAWHLTLPVSAFRQWLVKLSVSGALAVVFGLFLPVLLAWLTLPKVKVGLMDLLYDEEAIGLLLVLIGCGLTFVLSFWSATLVSNTIRAALTSVVMLAVLLVSALLGSWCAQQFGGVLTYFVMSLIVHFQLPPDYFQNLTLNPAATLLLVAPLPLLALLQSLRLFRLAESQSTVPFKDPAILVLTGFLLAFFFSDLVISVSNQSRTVIVAEIQNAVRAHLELNPKTGRVLTVLDLERVAKLTDETKTWLKNTTIWLTPLHANQQKIEYRVCLNLPNERHYFFFSQAGRLHLLPP